jgi:ubiquinone/menaquinone biosynthesis C-methylase UbiE
LREEDTSEYWDKKWAYGEHRHERVILDGSDGEREFDKELRLGTVGKIVLDEGCGRGHFTLRIAAKAKQVKGIDISTTALRQAESSLVRSKLTNVEFSLEDAGDLSFPKNTFDIVYSRRGPGSDNTQTLSEAYRVLRKNGKFMEITIGERDKQNLARIFGRGQMLGVKRQVSLMKKEMLEKVGFRKVAVRDYLGTEVFRAMSDLLVRLRSAPIIPAFDPRRDRRFLKRVQKECVTDRGIETPVHRVVLIGSK